MYSPQALLSLARTYAAAEGTALATLGRRITGNDKFFLWIAAGGDSKWKNVATASDWFDANWPPHVPWPPGIKRRPRKPTRRKKTEE